MAALPANSADEDRESPRLGAAPVALITGAARNIGRATAIAMAHAGWRVFATDIERDGVADTVAEIVRTHGPGWATAHVCDLALPETPATLVDAVETMWSRLDTIVHCAVDHGRGAVGTWTVGQWDAAIAVNVRSAAFLVQAALPQLRASDQASVVLLSSVHSQVTHPSCVLYAATKGAVDSMTRGLAVELGPAGVRVNAIHPGWVLDETFTPTALHLSAYPLGRLGSAEDIADAVVFLASSGSAWISGTILTVDGGSRALSPESSALHATRLSAATASRGRRFRERVRRFGGPTRR